jgi:methylenetetrahydrofolate reductase (NADPH)
MSGIKPARRWQPAFFPFKRETFGKRLLALTERTIKGPLFGCRMCGNCLLQETAFICPMECPKGMRNGPCGGIRPDKKCYVDSSRKCVWYAIYKRAFRTGRQVTLLEILPPLDWCKTGTDTWGDVIRQVRKTGTLNFFKGIFSDDKTRHKQVWDSVFKTIRQPGWWEGDSEYHAPGYREPVSEFEKQLRSGKFVVATEITPPTGSSTSKLLNDIGLVKPFVSAVNFTESSSTRSKMSSLACSTFAARNGIEPVVQITCRDTTRTGLQANAVGLNAMGIYNVLCITGDNASIGCAPYANMNILDIDSVQMLWIMRKMRDEGIYLDGRKIKEPPRYFLGAATAPFASDPEFQALKDQKKVNAGAQFFQTNLVFEPEKLDPWLEQLDRRNVLDKVYILIGIAPLKSYRIAEYLNSSVPGVTLPGHIMERMKKAGDSAPEEGIQICLELISRIKGKQGVNGIHIMTLGLEASVERIIRESGLYN